MNLLITNPLNLVYLESLLKNSSKNEIKVYKKREMLKEKVMKLRKNDLQKVKIKKIVVKRNTLKQGWVKRPWKWLNLVVGNTTKLENCLFNV